jgi:hypothetical protein
MYNIQILKFIMKIVIVSSGVAANLYTMVNINIYIIYNNI